MKKTFLPNRNIHSARRIRKNLWAGITGTVLLLFFLWQPAILPNVLYVLATPLVRVSTWIGGGVSELSVYLTSKSTLARENKILSDRLKSQQLELSLMRSIFPDYSKLKVFLEGEENSREALAGVLLAPPVSPYDILVLEAGAREGISIGDAVKTIDGIVLGSISEVFRDFSRATLLSAPGQKVAVRIGDKGIQAEASGVGAGEFHVTLPREFEISIGDAVMFPGIMPKPVGTVGSVEFRDVDFLQLISFRSPVNFSALKFVLIEKSSILTEAHE